MQSIGPDRTQPERPAHLLRDNTRFALSRIAVFQYLSVGIFLFLISGFWVLQVRDHEANSELAERNSIKTVPLLAPRGKILDRDGRVIVDKNHSAFEFETYAGKSEAGIYIPISRKVCIWTRKTSSCV